MRSRPLKELRFLAIAAFLGTLVVFSLLPTTSKAGRVLLLGDSISMGYTEDVQDQLAGKAEVERAYWSGTTTPQNCRYASYGLSNLDTWLGTGQWDVIHFNWGIWDASLMDMDNGGAAILDMAQEPAVTLDAEHGYVYDANGYVDSPPTVKVRTKPEHYRIYLSAILDKLQLHSPDARLIFATSTQLIDRRDHNPNNLVLIETLNEVATELMMSRGVAINDLYQLVDTQGEDWYGSDGLHFTPAGYEHLATQVSNSILVPEPSTFVLLGMGTVGLLLVRRKRRR